MKPARDSLTGSPRPRSPLTPGRASQLSLRLQTSRSRERRGYKSGELKPARRPIAIPSRKVFLVLLFLIGQALFVFSDLFHLSRVVVLGQTSVPRELILRRAQLPEGAPVWLINPGAVAERVTGLHEVAWARVSLQLPGTVQIQVKERRPVLLVSSRLQPGQYYSVDQGGMVIRPAVLPSELVRVEVDEPVVQGGHLSQGVVPIAREALALLGATLPGSCHDLRVDKMETVVARCLVRGFPLEVRLGSLQQREVKKHLLMALVRRMDAQKQRPVLMDLRYSSPVLKLAEPPSDFEEVNAP